MPPRILFKRICLQIRGRVTYRFALGCGRSARLRLRRSTSRRVPRKPSHRGYETRPMSIGVAIIGSGGIALANHLPGFALCPDTQGSSPCATAIPKCSPGRAAKTGITHDVHRLRQDLAHRRRPCRRDRDAELLHAPIALAASPGGQARAVREADRDGASPKALHDARRRRTRPACGT